MDKFMEIILVVLQARFLLKFLVIFTGDKNGGLIYSHFQNSKTVWNSPTKLGEGV
jgi:hypothetical protein